MNDIFGKGFKWGRKIKHFLNIAIVLLLINSPRISVAANADFSIAEAQSVQIIQEQQADHTRMSFSAFGRTFNLLMQRNEALMKNYSSLFLEVDLFAGTIEGVAGSWARISIVDGEFSGAVFDGNELFLIDNGSMVADSVDASQKDLMLQTATVVYRASDVTSTAICSNHDKDGAQANFSYAELVSDIRQQRAAATGQSANATGDATGDATSDGTTATATAATATATQQVNVSIFADTQYVATSPNGAEAQVLSQMNIVDGIFSEQVGVQFGITQITPLADNGPLTSSNSSTLLRQFQTALNGNNPGLSHLFTGRDIDGNVIGIAFLNGICTVNGVGVTQAGGRGTFGALTAAHEFGHNFGAPHDNQAGSACASSPGTFLMNPSLNGSDQFSQCSLQQIDNVLSVRNACLVDVDVPAPAPAPAPTASCEGETNFASGANGYSFVDDPQTPAYTSGSISGGSLNVAVGGVDNADITDMEGAWRSQCETNSAGPVTIRVNGSLSQASDYESNEFSQITLRVNGNETVLATLTGNGNGGGAQSTGAQQFTASATLAAGTNTIDLLCFNNQKTFNNESTNCSFASIDIEGGSSAPAPDGSIIDVDFNSAFGGFSFVDDASDPLYADGNRTTNGGLNNSGALVTTLGGVDNADITNMEGVWVRNFTAPQAGQLTLTLDTNLIQAEGYEPNENSEIGIMIDNRSLVLNTIVGDGNGGGAIGTGFQRFNISFDITAGTHSVSLFCRNSAKTVASEVTNCIFDNVLIE